MTQMDLEKFLLMLDTERARLMLQDLRDDSKRSPQLYNAIEKLLARHFGVKQSEVVYFSVGVDLGGYKVIYDKETQRAYSLPTDIAPGITAISLSAAVLVHSAGSVDLGELAVYRDLKSNENAP